MAVAVAARRAVNGKAEAERERSAEPVHRAGRPAADIGGTASGPPSLARMIGNRGLQNLMTSGQMTAAGEQVSERAIGDVRETTVRTPVSELIPALPEQAKDPEAGPEQPVFIARIAFPEAFLDSEHDAVSATITHVPSIAQGGATPTAFGVTNSGFEFQNVVITPVPGAYQLVADLVHKITWQVRSGTGPSGQVDIAGDTDTDITQANYPTVVSDLTPDMSSSGGRPPRTGFWAEDLTIRHEKVHTRQRSGTYGPAMITAMQGWLNAQTAGSTAAVQALLPLAMNEGIRAFNAYVAAPADEQEAYGDGVPAYRSRAQAIKTAGVARKYP